MFSESAFCPCCKTYGTVVSPCALLAVPTTRKNRFVQWKEKGLNNGDEGRHAGSIASCSRPFSYIYKEVSSKREYLFILLTLLYQYCDLIPRHCLGFR